MMTLDIKLATRLWETNQRYVPSNKEHPAYVHVSYRFSKSLIQRACMHAFGYWVIELNGAVLPFRFITLAHARVFRQDIYRDHKGTDLHIRLRKGKYNWGNIKSGDKKLLDHWLNGPLDIRGINSLVDEGRAMLIAFNEWDFPYHRPFYEGK